MKGAEVLKKMLVAGGDDPCLRSGDEVRMARMDSGKIVVAAYRSGQLRVSYAPVEERYALMIAQLLLIG